MRRLALAVVVLAAVAVYVPALRNGFVWDDRLVLGKQLAHFDDVRTVFFPGQIPQASRVYYRPLVTVTYLADRAAGGGAPLPFHVTPIALHAVAAALLFLLIRRLVGPDRVAAATLAALAFAVHPVHAEVVAWMAGRAEALATAALVGAFLLCGRWLDGERAGWLVGGAVALVAALLGKETALAGIPLAAALPFVWPGRRAAREAPVLWGALAAAVAAYLVLRSVAVGVATGVARPFGAARPEELLGALGFYAEALAWPRLAGAVRSAAPTDAFHVALGAAVAVAGGAGFMVALRKRANVVAWSIAWIGIAFVPPLVLVVRAISETPVGDRYVYLPSAGAALLLACALARVRSVALTTALVAATLAAIVAGGIATARRAPIWRDDPTFWQNAVAAVPDEGYAHGKLALALYERGDLAAAEAQYRAALAGRINPPERAIVENNLGYLLLREKRWAEAEPLFRSAIVPGPRFSGPYRGLAESLLARATDDAPVPAEIRPMLERALEVDPADARAALLLGRLSIVEGKRDEGVRWLSHAARVAPESASADAARATLARLGVQ
jgi:tetratricopeptide (TPR) repeat protein